MIIYKDAVTGSELFSDTYKIKVVDGCLYEVDCKRMKYDKNDASATSACAFNPSAEQQEQDEGADDNPDIFHELDCVYENRLQDAGCFTKKTYQGHLKEYFKSVKQHLQKTNPERVDAFMAEAKVAAGKLLKKVGDCCCYNGENQFLGNAASTSAVKPLILNTHRCMNR